MSKESQNSAERPPIVVVMGHVDHGKSTLLDYIRKSNTVDREAGGITQHVAAYEVQHPAPNSTVKNITFIDTPGHAAFRAIRARGANVADIAILVVAADDGVKAQTLEALASIREADIPFIVAINKIDKPNADISRTQGSLLEQNVYLEKMGGDVPWVSVSAKTGAGIPELLDLILLVAELHEFKADSAKNAEGYVIEAHRDQKRGIAATLIITEGTLKSGMAILAGSAIAPVRIMENFASKALKEATFSSPITLVGFDALPGVGERFTSFKSKKEAEAARSAIPVQANAIAETISADAFQLPVIIRADATGSLEAIMHELERLGDDRSKIRIIQSGIGNISENDVKTVMASQATRSILVGFHVSTDSVAEALARQQNITIEHFDIIYKMTERLAELLKTNAPKRIVEEVLGKAKVLKQFSSNKDSQVIGGAVTEGQLRKKGTVRVLRRRIEIGTGKIINIQSNKQNVDKVEIGSEFGAQIECSFEIAEGDMLENFEITEE